MNNNLIIPDHSVPMKPDGFTEVSQRYGELIPLRALVSAIPYIGGALDILLYDKGAKFQWARLEHFLKCLDERMRLIESSDWLEQISASEELLDLFALAVQGSIQSRSKKKREQFATLIAKGALARNWDEAELASRILADLSESHIEILHAVSTTAPLGDAWHGRVVVTLTPHDTRAGGSDNVTPSFLPDLTPGYPIGLLRKYCADLVAQGMLIDEGVSHLDTEALDTLSLSDFGEWFMSWILDDSK